MKTKREVSAVGGVQLIVRGPDGFPVEIVLLGAGSGVSRCLPAMSWAEHLPWGARAG